MLVLGQAVQQQAPLAVRWACLVHDLGKGTTPADVLPRHIGHEQRGAKLVRQVGERWRVPKECSELAELVAAEHGNIHRSLDLSPAAVLRLLQRCDALRKPERFAQALWACECDARGRWGFEAAAYPQRGRLAQALAVALGVATGPIAAQAVAAGKQGAAIGQAVDAVRVQALAATLNKPPL